MKEYIRKVMETGREMNLNAVGKRVLLVTIVLLSLAWLVQPALAADSGRYDNVECEPLIKEVYVNGNYDVIIKGECLYSGGTPQVMLSGADGVVIDTGDGFIAAHFDHPEPGAPCVLEVCIAPSVCDRLWLDPIDEDLDLTDTTWTIWWSEWQPLTDGTFTFKARKLCRRGYTKVCKRTTCCAGDGTCAPCTVCSCSKDPPLVPIPTDRTER